nr:MAG TPA: minor structural protein [Caudoviricetes sp.]
MDLKLSRMLEVSGMGKEVYMKLEELLGTDLYAQVKAKIDEQNANEPDKLKHVRYADLSEGEYVGKGKYDSEIEKLNAIISGKDTELATANTLIGQLKKGTQGDEAMLGKIKQYEEDNAKLQKQLKETKMKAAIKVALMSEKAVDVDYLTFKLNEKLKEKGETLELDENDNIKGWSDKLSGLKTQFPTMFESGSKVDNGYNRMDSGKLPGADGDHDKVEPKDLAEALQQQFEESTK